MTGFFGSLLDPTGNGPGQGRGFFGPLLPALDDAPDGGGADPNVRLAGDTAPVAGAAAAPSIMTYPDGSPVVDPVTHQPYPRPPTLDMNDNLGVGQSIKRMRTDLPPVAGSGDLAFGSLFPQGAPMDYQRPHGRWAAEHHGDFNGNYTNVTAYNLGAVGAAAGYDLDTLLTFSGLYNQLAGKPDNANTPYGLNKDRVTNITHGYNDFIGGRWTKK